MNIEQQFNRVAKEYDANRRKFIPCFDDYYIKTTDFLVSGMAKPKRFIDLGTGTGLLTYYWYQRCPETEYLLVDIADEMLNIARERFSGIDNISYAVWDYSNGLPSGDFDVIASALSIHHLENAEKMRLFADIYDKLPSGGMFVNYDQFCAGNEEMNVRYDSYWENQLLISGLTENDISLWKERRKLDKECSVNEETDMLCGCGFKTVNCVYSCRKFSVIAAIK